MSEKEVAVSMVEKDDYSIEGSIERWRRGLVISGAYVFGIYVVYFFLIPGQAPEKSAEKLGQFGDFIGGLLNPLVAFAAFYWLTQSVKLQKQELADTRKALEDSAVAQVEQAESSRRSVRISALSALLNSTQLELATQQTLLNNFEINVPINPGERRVYWQDSEDTRKNARDKVKELMGKKSSLEDELRNALDSETN